MLTPIVLFDACVLYHAPLRDLLMHLSLSGLFRAKWTNEIQEEWISNLLDQRPDLSRIQLERTRDLMNTHVLDALVENYEGLKAKLSLPDPDDFVTHVLGENPEKISAIVEQLRKGLKNPPLHQVEYFNILRQRNLPQLSLR